MIIFFLYIPRETPRENTMYASFIINIEPVHIGIGRFRILGGQGLEFWGGGQGGGQGGQIPSRHMTS